MVDVYEHKKLVARSFNKNKAKSDNTCEVWGVPRLAVAVLEPTKNPLQPCSLTIKVYAFALTIS